MSGAIESLTMLAKPSGVLSSPLEPLHSKPISEGVTLHVSPGKQFSWEEFGRYTPRYSIALDGFVRGMPRLDRLGVRANFNHHEEVVRFATRCTTSQVYMAIKDGTIDLFKDPSTGAPHMNLYVNDPDQDSALAVWLLTHYKQELGGGCEKIFRRLLYLEDMLDTTAGAFPFNPDDTAFRQLAWVFEPYVRERQCGQLATMCGQQVANIIAAVGTRISDYIHGNAQSIPADTRYEVIGGGTGWTMLKMIGFYARARMGRDGVQAYVAYEGERNGYYKYSLGKLSVANPFPVEDLYTYLNSLEGIQLSSHSCWGGSDTVGGSPRPTGSSLSPCELENAINQFLTRRNGSLH